MDCYLSFAILPEESEKSIHNDCANISEIVHVKELGRDEHTRHREAEHDDELEVVTPLGLIGVFETLLNFRRF